MPTGITSDGRMLSPAVGWLLPLLSPLHRTVGRTILLDRHKKKRDGQGDTQRQKERRTDGT